MLKLEGKSFCSLFTSLKCVLSLKTLAFACKSFLNTKNKKKSNMGDL